MVLPWWPLHSFPVLCLHIGQQKAVGSIYFGNTANRKVGKAISDNFTNASIHLKGITHAVYYKYFICHT